ncbi:hypothetical protein D3C80_1433170 [compost metagenome]
MKEKTHVAKGNFLSFFTNKNRLILYLKCIGIGLPTWYIIGVLATFSNEFGKALGISEAIKPGLAVMWCYVGLSIGDLLSGVVSYWLESRIRTVTYMMAFTVIGALIYLYAGITTSTGLYAICVWMGFGIGYWAMFVTIGAEQFGTNVRATAATTIPNMVRGTVVLMTTLYTTLKPHVFELKAAGIVGLICFGIGFYCIRTIPETHHKDLDFIEED